MEAVRYITHRNIDKAQWDACIANAPNGLVYAYSIYLDHMAPGWDALVLGDYDLVFPLPWRKKYGLSYLYHPFLTAQLGLFGKGIDKIKMDAFLEAIPAKFRYIDMPLNRANIFASTFLPLYLRNNYILDLDRPYENIRIGYRENIKRNIKKAMQYGCYATTEVSIEEVIALSNEHTKDEEGFRSFRKLFDQMASAGQAKCYGIRDANRALLASAAFLYSHNRAYYILVGNHPNGRTLGASHMLIDSFIKDHAGKKIFLDFEGSDIRNLAFFYSSFGATEEKYAAIRYNRLPWYLKWMKS